MDTPLFANLSATTFVACCVVLFAAGFIRGFTGYGFGIAAVPLMGFLMPPDIVVPLVLLLQALVGLHGLGSATTSCDIKSVFPIAIGAALATMPGLALTFHLPPADLRLAIAIVASGSVTALFAMRRTLPTAGQRGRSNSLLVGLLAGLANGMAAMPGPPIVTYYLRAGLPAARMRANLVVCFALISAVSVVCTLAYDVRGLQPLVLTGVTAPAVLLGSRAGTCAFHTALGRHFKLMSHLLLGMMALLAVLRSAADWL